MVKSKMKWRYLGTCQYKKECNNPSIAKVWWEGFGEKTEICQEHLNYLIMEETRSTIKSWKGGDKNNDRYM